MFTKCRHDDGKLEVMGLTGVVHLGQIQSGLRTAIRLAQGAHVRTFFYTSTYSRHFKAHFLKVFGGVVFFLIVYNFNLYIKT